jgi:hypothetical protein
MTTMIRSLLLLFSLSLLISSCQFSKGVKKDLNTGLSTSYNGFTLDDIYLADESGSRLNDNTIPMGSKVLVIATGVDYFAEKEGKVFPGCSIILLDKYKKEILNLPDALSGLKEGLPSREAKTLQAQLNTGSPMTTGETYHLSVRFFDKNKIENEIVSNADLVMKE